ncbi:MAG: hypothetical protein ACTHLY_06745 [Pseudolabrys sp.]
MTLTLTHYFLAFTVAVGVAVGAAIVEFPALRDSNLPSYLLILIGLAAFDIACYWRSGGAPGGVVSMPVRFAGFGLALAVMLAVTYWSGVDAKLM